MIWSFLSLWSVYDETYPRGTQHAAKEVRAGFRGNRSCLQFWMCSLITAYHSNYPPSKYRNHDAIQTPQENKEERKHEPSWTSLKLKTKFFDWAFNVLAIPGNYGRVCGPGGANGREVWNFGGALDQRAAPTFRSKILANFSKTAGTCRNRVFPE